MQSLLDEETREYGLSGGLSMGIMAPREPKVYSLWRNNCRLEDCYCNGVLQPGHPPLITGDIGRDFVTNNDGSQEEVVRGISEIYIIDPPCEPEEEGSRKDNPKKGSQQDSLQTDNLQKDTQPKASGTETEVDNSKMDQKTPVQVRRIAQGCIPITSLLGNTLDVYFMNPEPHPAPSIISPTSAAITLPTPPPSTAASDISHLHSPASHEAGLSSPRSEKHVRSTTADMECQDFGNGHFREAAPISMEVDEAYSASFSSNILPHASSMPLTERELNLHFMYETAGNGTASSPSLVPDPSQSLGNQPAYPAQTLDLMEVDQSQVLQTPSQTSSLAAPLPTSTLLHTGYRTTSDAHTVNSSYLARTLAYPSQIHPILIPSASTSTDLPPAKSGRPPRLQINSVEKQYPNQSRTAPIYTQQWDPQWGTGLVTVKSQPKSAPSNSRGFSEASSSTASLPPLPDSIDAPTDIRRPAPRVCRTSLPPVAQAAGVDQGKRRVNGANSSKSRATEKSCSTTERRSPEDSAKSEHQGSQPGVDSGDYENIDDRPSTGKTTNSRAKPKFACPQAGCGKTFTRKNDVRRHMASAAAHRDFGQEDQASEARCKKCNRILSRGDSARRHQMYSACGKRTLPSEQKTKANENKKQVVQGTGGNSQGLLL